MDQVAKFWKYTGNHHAGKDHERNDPHTLGLELISAMAYWADGGDYQSPLTYSDTKMIKATHHKGESFGHEITVSAPKEVWQRGKIALEAMKASL